MKKRNILLGCFVCFSILLETAWSESPKNKTPGVQNNTIQDACLAYGPTLRKARRAFRAMCGSKPKDCDPGKAKWLCASVQIGDRLPVVADTKSCIVWRHSLKAAKKQYAASCSLPRADCDRLNGGWQCSSNNIASNSSRSDLLTELIRSQSGGRGLSAFVLPQSDDYRAIPADSANPLGGDKIALGKMLFHDTRFSQNGFSDQRGSWSCASCHHAAAGFKSGLKQGIGEGGIHFGKGGADRELATGFDAAADDGAANKPDIQPLASPTILNTAYQDVMLWNGQFGNSQNGGVNASVPDEILSTPGTPKEANMRQLSGLEIQAIAGTGVHRLKFDEQSLLDDTALYQQLWNNAYGSDSTDFLADAGKAIAAFERSVLANQAPFQEWLRGDNDALTDTEINGGILFFGKAGCSDCHRGPALSSEVGALKEEIFFNVGFADFDVDDERIHGVVSDADSKGRGGFTGLPDDAYRFKIPQLYNLIDTNVFGHGASFNSVEAVVAYKNRAGPQTDAGEYSLDYRFVPLGLSGVEMHELSVFLKYALYDPNLARYQPSTVPDGSCVVIDPLDNSSSEHCND